MPPADPFCSFFIETEREQGVVLVAPRCLTRVLTIKNRPILGTIIAYGVAVATQFVTVPTIAVELTRSDVESGGGTVVLAHSEAVQPMSAYTSTEAHVRSYFSDIPIMAEVARCESHFVHTNPHTGSVLTGHMNPSDIGVMQINKMYHESAALRMGLDIYSLEDNLAYARFLYNTQGTQPWSASRYCWGTHDLAMN